MTGGFQEGTREETYGREIGGVGDARRPKGGYGVSCNAIVFPALHFEMEPEARSRYNARGRIGVCPARPEGG